MAVYLSLTAIVVALGFFIKNSEYAFNGHRNSFLYFERFERQQAFNAVMAFVIFILLTLVSACRIAVGNDYWVYRFQFNLIMQDRHVSYEMGFNAVVKAIQYLFGYDNYLPVFAFFSIVTCAFFVKAMYDQSRFFAGSIFLLMTCGYYFSSLNTVRYYMCLAIALFSMKYVIEKRYISFIVCIILASLFHKTVLLVIPVYLFAGFLADRKWKKAYTLILIVGAVLFVALEPVWRKVIFIFYPYYEGSVFDVRNISLANVAKCVGVIILWIVTLIFYKGDILNDRANRFYFFLNVGGLLVFTLGTFIPENTRVGYYFIISQVMLIPNLIQGMEKGKLRTIITAGCALVFLLYFAMFLRNAYAVDIRLLPYR
ncbi:MAG: EpsG family protein, partial [Lachnospiraceae bacterium]|nr:EpsG family protein [Lachnospiraceae bacterium]